MKQRGKSVTAVDRIVAARDTVSPGSRERRGLIAFMARAVGWDRRARRTKEIASACLNFIVLPNKLPNPAYISQKDKVIPISSSLPENVDSRRRKTVICKSREVKPMIIKGRKVFSRIMMLTL
jgi:hypothetical protein